MSQCDYNCSFTVTIDKYGRQSQAISADEARKFVHRRMWMAAYSYDTSTWFVDI